MKKIIFIIGLVFLSFTIIACDDSGNSKSDNADNAVTAPSEKTYIINPLPEADFYYFTESGKLYIYKNSEISLSSMTVTIKQDGYADVIQNIIPVDFYRLGLIYNFEFEIEGETYLYNQIKGENNIYLVSSLYRRPDTVHVTMNNSRFSIEINTWDIYTVSDIRNLTEMTGTRRTLMCTNYYIGAYTSRGYDYGLFFVAKDDIPISSIPSGLWYLSEFGSTLIKAIDEYGEMW